MNSNIPLHVPIEKNEKSGKFFFPFFGSRGLPARARRGPILQGLRWKFKNRYGDPNSMPLKYSQRKNQPNRPSGLGCRGGCHRFGVLLILYLGSVCTVCYKGILFYGKNWSDPIQSPGAKFH